MTAIAAFCKTEPQMTDTQRYAQSTAARVLTAEAQCGVVQAIRTNGAPNSVHTRLSHIN
jgi:hypothetical protein